MTLPVSTLSVASGARARPAPSPPAALGRALTTVLRARTQEHTAMLRTLVRTYARASRGAGVPPETVLIAVKACVRGGLALYTVESRDARALTALVVRWALEGYYRED